MTTTQLTWPTNAIPEKWIDDLFDRMLMTFGKKFGEQWKGTDPAKLKEFWAMRMYDLRPEEMKRGVAAMQKLKWPPTLNEFFELCRPSIDTAAAYYEAVSGMEARKRGEKGEWSHPAIFWTASKMTHDLLNQTFSVVKLRWEKELAKELEKTAWPEVPEVAKALPAPGKTKTDRERAKHELEKLNASGLLRKTSGVAWAKKVLERVDRGESLPAISVQWAMETVGNKLQQGGA